GYDGGVTGGNVAVRVTNDGVILVDNKFPHSFRTITSEVRKVTSLPIRYVLDTHHHGDHAGSNADFMAVGEVIAHRNARANMIRGNQPGAPRVVFGSETSVFLGGVETRAHHFGRGHTDGDAVIYFTGSNVIHMGDDFFQGRFPFVDIASGGTVEGLERGIGDVLQHAPDDVAIIPGHGALSTIEDLETYHRMLRETIAMVREKMDRGLSAEDIAAGGVSDEWTDWGSGFINTERWLGTIYQSLEGTSDGDYVDHGHGSDGSSRGGTTGHRHRHDR
ncbi:MAG: MBL fold metallo-hydrolase, partial [Gemmatimonadetes bacterium]|nr:MBL fold metallo-hydrolase [Gemmatimonadota bacterium]